MKYEENNYALLIFNDPVFQGRYARFDCDFNNYSDLYNIILTKCDKNIVMTC